MREEVQSFPADRGRLELNALTPTYFSGAHGQAQIKGEKEQGRRERREEGREQLRKRHLRELLAVWLVEGILLFLVLLPSGHHGHWHGCLGDPGDPGSQAAPHLSSAEQMVAGDVASHARQQPKMPGLGTLELPCP